MENLIETKDLKKILSDCKKQVKARKGKEGNSFLSSGRLSDLITNLCVMKTLGGGDLYIRVIGAEIEDDPYKDMEPLFTNVSLYVERSFFTQDMFDYWKPLLEAQPYVKSVNVYHGEEVTFNLDTYRYCYFNNEYLDKTQGILLKALIETWGIKISFSKPWITVDNDKDLDRKVLVARSVKYHGGDMNYNTMVEFLVDNSFFYGTDMEYMNFGACCCILWRLKPDSALDLAACLKSMELVFANENFMYWLAIALGVKEIHYELCPDFYYGINDNQNVKYFLGNNYVFPADVSFNVKNTRKKKDVPAV